MKRYIKLWHKLSKNDLFKAQMSQYAREVKDYPSLPGMADKMLSDWELIHLGGDAQQKQDLYDFRRMLKDLIDCNVEFYSKVFDLPIAEIYKLHCQWRLVLSEKIQNLIYLKTCKTVVKMFPATARKFLKFGENDNRFWASGNQLTPETKICLLGIRGAPKQNGFPDSDGAARFVNVYKFYPLCQPYCRGSLEWQYVQLWGIIFRLSDSICDSTKQLKHALPQWNNFFNKWIQLIDEVLHAWNNEDILK